MWLHISGELNCCQEFQERSGILIGVRIKHIKDIKDVKDINLQTKELGCN